MTHNIIKTKNYLLVVDDSEIKYDDHFIDEYKMLYMLKTESTEKYKSVKKVISHLPLNNSPILEGVPLLPPLEDEVDSWITNTIGNLKDEHTKKTAAISLKGGYKKAKEKYKYTEEEYNKLLSFIKKIDDEGYDPYDSAHHLQVSRYVDEVRNIIQSLQQPKMPVAFECEESVDSDSMYVDYVIYKPKTTTNPQGQTEWVGKYIY
jgi:hypothetical protein